MRSWLEIFDLATGSIVKVHETEAHVEAPNRAIRGGRFAFMRYH